MNAWYLTVFVLYLAFLLGSCLISLRKVESNADFTSGGHRMGLWVGVGTTTATWVSVASVLGVPGYLYSTGVAAIIGWVAGWFFGSALIPIVAYKVRRPKTPARTFPEFVQMRYEPRQRRSGLRVLVAALMLVGYFIFVHLQVVGFGIVFETVTGVPYEVAIFAFLAILLVTSLGGFWSVAATDAVNTVLIVTGVTLGAFAVLDAAGGWSTIVATLETSTAPAVEGEAPMEAGVLLTPLGTFGFGALLSIFVANSLGASVAPHWVTRMMVPRNVKTAVVQVMISLGVLVMIFVPLIVIGLGAKTLVPTLPEGRTTDYIMPFVIIEYTHPLVGALTLVALAGAAVSTANSMLLHCGTSVHTDIYATFARRKAPSAGGTDRTRTQLRIVVLVLGVLAVLSAINPPMLLAMGFTYVYGGFGAAFFFVVYFGLYTKRMNRMAAYANIILGLGTFGIAQAMGAGNPFLIALGVAGAGVLAAILWTPKPPREAYEPYFEVDVRPETQRTLDDIMGGNHAPATADPDHPAGPADPLDAKAGHR
ncbi:sodium:solute symporter [Saccharomonospora sp. CUA-673]|uniref:sodium:solute symporter family protein n=1 Tax=Saccharomonospora sp. CUA-673 TaxID=1904969 RepID=UPI000962AE9F|nr:sodium:solute symporter family protein [Saccharomonospora sp. CUA-673]OLT45921.1 sodium:solute symporter [Saccharomonospora sp. CUA-673]